MREPVWIDERDAIAIHDRLLRLHGGPAGTRDESLLKSALEYSEGADLIDLAAVYTAGILQNHPFVDGNKRTGFVIGILFLELNGFRFKGSEENATQAVLELAAGSLDEPGYARFLRENVVSG